MPTITDVAARAKVSTKTVSRVLNNEAHVRPALKARVEAAVKDLGYRPNLAARQLASNRSFILGYLLNNPSAGYMTDVLIGAADACRKIGYHLVTESAEAIADVPTTIDRLVRTLRPDGLILTPPLADMTSVLDQLEALEIPVVKISGGMPGYGETIAIDERAVSIEMVKHLVSKGHRRIGFIKPPPDHVLAQSRFKGYREGLASANLPYDPALVQEGYFTVESGHSATERLLDLIDPPTAIFAANDDMALGALNVAHDRGLDIPKHLAIAGFDDSPASQLVWPPLTTVRQPLRELGAAAAYALCNYKAAVQTPLKHSLVIRRSTQTDI